MAKNDLVKGLEKYKQDTNLFPHPDKEQKDGTKTAPSQTVCNAVDARIKRLKKSHRLSLHPTQVFANTNRIHE